MLEDIQIKIDAEGAVILDKIISDAVTKAVRTIREEERKQLMTKSDIRLHNTKILLENYRNFKQHSQKSIKSINQLVEEKLQEISKVNIDIDFSQKWDDIYVDSIVKSSAKTAIILKQIDSFIEYYDLKCMSSKREDIRRRIKVIKMLYINEKEMTYEDIAEKLFINVRTVDNTRKAATRELSALFFGIDGVKLY